MSTPTADVDALEAFRRQILLAAGADTPSAEAAAPVMMHASIHGVESHGVRLLPHYDRVIPGGRVNGTPSLVFEKTRAGSGLLDGDHAHGALAAYTAAQHAADLAAEAGIGAVGIRHSTHFGAAGAYAKALAHTGRIGLAFCNSDAFVRLHNGAARFHGTNPIGDGRAHRRAGPLASQHGDKRGALQSRAALSLDGRQAARPDGLVRRGDRHQSA